MKNMSVITLEVPDALAKQFSGYDVVGYRQFLDYEDDLKYNFSDEKVSLNEVSDFLGSVISSNKSNIC